VTGPRIVTGSTIHVQFDVLLPTGYDAGMRAYPVLYLLHGAAGNRNTWLDHSDLERFTRPLTGTSAAIVVMPTGGDGLQVDWRDAFEQWDTWYTTELIPYVDAHFRTVADRAHRAIAGLSAGGFSAMYIAARHPDLFVAAGAFDGFPLDLTDPTVDPTLYPLVVVDQFCEGDPPPADGEFGNPVDAGAWIHGDNPTELARNLRGMSLYIGSATGVPCSAADAMAIIANTPYGELEPLVRRGADHFDAALTAAGIPHVTRRYPCGGHTDSRFQAGLHEFWPQMAAAFGDSPPARFDYRRVDPTFSVWGWSFAADPRRAPEFLDVRGAGPAGLILTGSGREHVVTPPAFLPHDHVTVVGATTSPIVADDSGRLRFDVDLGPAHAAEEFTPMAFGERFRTRRVLFFRQS
jgi:S-formylglutathione hydrolase FrmB